MVLVNKHRGPIYLRHRLDIMVFFPWNNNPIETMLRGLTATKPHHLFDKKEQIR